MDRPRQTLVKSPAQTYETTVHDRDSGRAFTFISVPSRSIGSDGGEVPPVDVLAGQLGLDRKPRRSSRPWQMREVPPWALPFVLDLALGRDPEDYYRWGPFFLEDYLFESPGRANRLAPSAFAQYLAYARVVPFESSPLTSKSLSDLAAAGGGLGGALGACVTGDPLLLLTIPAGIIVCGAARGISQALEIGLRTKLLNLMNVDDPYAGKGEPPPELPPTDG
jgi:hypothetical protein